MHGKEEKRNAELSDGNGPLQEHQRKTLDWEGRDPAKWHSLTPADSIRWMIYILPNPTASMKEEVVPCKTGDTIPKAKLNG